MNDLEQDLEDLIKSYNRFILYIGIVMFLTGAAVVGPIAYQAGVDKGRDITIASYLRIVGGE